MKRKINRQKATSIIEYVAIFSVVAMALVLMFSYLTRSLNGRWRQSADSFGYGLQYEPGKTIIKTTTAEGN